AALASIETMRELDLSAAARQIESAMLPRLRQLAEAHPVIGEVRGRGAMIAVELIQPGPAGPNGPTPNAAATQAVAKACHAAGLLVLTCGTYGNVLRFLPPLVMPDQTLHQGLDILADAFAGVS
ncbi:MAG TPA: aminotransferase class III-fold pyridoxal phosphate-dependent enzyme, partial [Micromonosporaceae bacterium]